MDPLSASLMTFGTILLICSWIYLLIVSFNDDFTWGLATIFLPPVSYFYSLFALDKAGAAVALAAIGSILIFLGL